MIASPGDIPEVRAAVYNALNLWNASFAMSRNIALIPLRWETAVPLLGAHPQYIINKQLTEEADILMAFFGSKLGTATPDAPSGTAEEIHAMERLGKPVHVYFSHLGHAPDVDPKGLIQLNEFRSKLGETGLYDNFQTMDELQYMIWRAIDLDIVQLGITASESVDLLASEKIETDAAGTDQTTLNPGASAALLNAAGAARDTSEKEKSVDRTEEPPRAIFHLQGGSERVESTNKKGKLVFVTRHWVEMTNRGERGAMSVKLEPVTRGIKLESDFLRTLHPLQTRRIAITKTFEAVEPRIKVSWTEGDRIFNQEWAI